MRFVKKLFYESCFEIEFLAVSNRIRGCDNIIQLVLVSYRKMLFLAEVITGKIR